MRVLVTGAEGMLAHALQRVLPSRGHAVLAYPMERLDVTDEAAVARVLESERPEAVIQCAAYTAVDRAEAEPEVAHRVNALGTRHVATACQKVGAVFVYPSTDYVFRGDADRPYRPTDPTDPVNEYGRSKQAGEVEAERAGRALIVRTSWLYGRNGANFVDTISRLARERDSIEVVADQVGRPTWTESLSGVVAELLEAGAVGTYHASDGGDPVSWYQLALEALRRQSIGTEVRPIGTIDFPRPAPRPRYSVLDLSATERLLGRPLSNWKDSLARHLGGGEGRAPAERGGGVP